MVAAQMLGERRLTRMRPVLGLVGVLAGYCVVCAQAPFEGDRYRNDNYGFSVDIPKGMTACVNNHGANHGVGLLLDAGPTCDQDSASTPRVHFFAEYNVAYEARSAEQLARILCNHVPLAEAAPEKNETLDGLVMDGRSSFGCRDTFADGAVYATIFVLRMSYPLTGRNQDFPDDWMEVGAWLVDDMRKFRSLLHNIHIDADAATK
jgi:hypothetical protein